MQPIINIGYASVPPIGPVIENETCLLMVTLSQSETIIYNFSSHLFACDISIIIILTACASIMLSVNFPMILAISSECMPGH